MLELNFPNAVSDEQDFYGRKKDIERIEHTLQTNHPMIILGERRMGKTSLQTITTKRLVAREAGRFVPLLLPSSSAIRSLNDYAQEILKSLCSYLGKSLQEIGLVNEKNRLLLVSIGQIKDIITRLLGKDYPKTFIICIDEFDAILINCAGDEANKILALTHYITATADLPLTMYLTMTRLPEYLRNTYDSPIFSSSDTINLEPFSQEEMVEMVKGLLGPQVVLMDQAMERLFHSSGGHPYFVKLLLSRLLKRYWSEETKETTLYVTEQMIEEAILDAADDSRALPVLNNLYRMHFNQEEQKLLLLLAERQAGITINELNILGPSFKTATKRLKRRGYLTWDETAGCNFRVGFLGRLLRHWEEYEVEKERLMEIKQRLSTGVSG